MDVSCQKIWVGPRVRLVPWRKKTSTACYGSSRRPHWAIPEKNQTGGWGHGISRVIGERKCGNSRGQLKKKWNFQGCSRENSWNFHGSCFLTLEFPRGVTILLNFQGWKLVLSGVYKGKVTKEKYSEKYILNPPVWIFFSGTAHYSHCHHTKCHSF